MRVLFLQRRQRGVAGVDGAETGDDPGAQVNSFGQVELRRVCVCVCKLRW